MVVIHLVFVTPIILTKNYYDPQSVFLPPVILAARHVIAYHEGQTALTNPALAYAQEKLFFGLCSLFYCIYIIRQIVGFCKANMNRKKELAGKRERGNF